MSALAGQAHAAETTTAAAPDDAVDAIIVTGTRTTGLRAADSPAPVQVLGADLLRRTGQPTLIQALAQNVPSIQAQSYGGDTAAFNLTFKLRGVSPNHTLVLINGKRRHGIANVGVSGGAYGGNAAADIGLIPTGAIDHVEVLQEGAAAQYGTDAIAGVVNIFLKKASSGGSITATGGEYFDGGGRTGEIAANIGFEPVDKAYFNVTASAKYHGFSFRGDIDPRVVSTTTSGAALLARYPKETQAAYYPYVNRIHGDAESRLYAVMYNAGYEFSDSLSFYTFGNYSQRFGQAYENYRLPSVVLGKMATDIPFPSGFSPKESLRQTEYAWTGGFTGKVGDWNWDLSTTYGHDFNGVYVLDSANSSLYADTSTTTAPGYSPSIFHDGDFVSSQWTNTLDVNKEFDVGLSKPLTFAAGGEYREDTYAIVAGDPSSYYKTGAQSFFGYSPVNAGKHKRHNWAIYADVAFNPVENLKLDAAVRHEDYSDFGATTVFKLTGRYDFNEKIAVRATGSTGFRAPTLGEEFYSGINVGPTSISGVFAPNSAGAAFLGLTGLGPEKSKNFSAGFVTHFLPRLTMTLDAFSIKIDNRILQSGSLTGYNSNINVVRSPSVLQALIANGVTIDPAIFTASSGSVAVVSFVNGVDTLTQGADFVATYSSDFGDYGRVDWSMSTNYTSTTIKRVAPPPANVAQNVALFDVPAQSTIKTSTPKWRATFGALWTLGKLSVNLRESFYGAAYTYAQDPIGAFYDKIAIKAALLTDLEVTYQVVGPVKVSIGANNLFNTYPSKQPAAYRAAQLATTASGYASSVYPTSSAFGINGGYYYGRIAVTF
ncbi:MAG TPA: TonB-dependent receptor [Caulobacteraceae bacterium]|nr:TonB-dependent receptor [Caulobacteraceae bacterium]